MVRNGHRLRLFGREGGGVGCLPFVRDQRAAVAIHSSRTIARAEQWNNRVGIGRAIRSDFEYDGATGYDDFELAGQRA